MRRSHSFSDFHCLSLWPHIYWLPRCPRVLATWPPKGVRKASDADERTEEEWMLREEESEKRSGDLFESLPNGRPVLYRGGPTQLA